MHLKEKPENSYSRLYRKKRQYLVIPTFPETADESGSPLTKESAAAELLTGGSMLTGLSVWWALTTSRGWCTYMCGNAHQFM